MKRFISLSLVLVMVMSGIVAFAEETPTTEVPPRVIYTLKVTQDNPKVCGIIEIMGWGEKQPLIFQDSPENPKTGFSRMTPEEIALLQEEPYRFEIVGTIDHMSFDTGLKAALTTLDEFYTYNTKKDGTVVRKLRTEVFSASKNPIMSGGHRKIENQLFFSVSSYEMSIMYEQWAYSLIEDIAPITDIQTTQGLTCDKLRYMLDCMKVDTLGKKDDHTITREVLELKSKTKKQTDEDKKYVTEMLLNVKPGEDFWKTYGLLEEIFTWLGYKYDDGHIAFVVK